MTSLYCALGILLLIGTFQVYLLLTDQHIHSHVVKDDKKHLWREGRAWFSLAYNDETRDHKYYPPPRLHPWWYLFRPSPLGMKFYHAGEEFDVQVFIGFLIGRVGLSIEGTRFFRWLFRRVYRMGWGYGTGVELDFLDGQVELTIYWNYNDMASAPSLRLKVPAWRWLYNYKRRRILSRHWERSVKLLNLRILRRDARDKGYLEIDPLPAGFHFWWAVDYIKDKMPTGGGWRFSIDFDRIVLGSHERTEENIGEPIIMDIPIEPDNRLGLRYSATFQRQAETRWRTHFPWRKKLTLYWDVSTRNPPLHAGKGENSWDLDDDGIFGCAVTAETVEGAVAEYVAKCQRDRKKYGLPNVIYKMQRKEETHG